MPELVRLETWARSVYGDDAPDVHTLQRWCREHRIWPLPELHGRSYYLRTDARRVARGQTVADLAAQHVQQDVAAAAVQRPRGRLAQLILNGEI